MKKEVVRAWKKGWKVVNCTGGNCWSLYKNRKYVPGEKTFPCGGSGPLTVLKTKKGAEFLLAQTYVEKAELWECKYLLSKETEVWEFERGSRTTIAISNLEGRNRAILLPGTTALADAVILTKKLKGKRKNA